MKMKSAWGPLRVFVCRERVRAFGLFIYAFISLRSSGLRDFSIFSRSSGYQNCNSVTEKWQNKLNGDFGIFWHNFVS